MNHSSIHRRLASFALAITCLGGFTVSAVGQDYPTKPVRMVVNFPPGGVADQIARVLAPQLQRSLGQPFIVENRSGGNGNIGAGEVAKAPADGYTLLLSPSGIITVNGLLYQLPFDPMKDFEPIASQGAVNVFLVVKPGMPVSTLQEFLAYARANPGKLNFGTPGSGSSPHLAAELFKRLTKVEAMHIPYKGAAPALTDLLGGQIDFMFDPGVALPHIKSGKLRLLAVGSPKRHPAFPNTPTVSEGIGEEFDAGTIFGVLAPAGTPKAATMRLDSEIARIMRTPEMTTRITSMGAEPVYLGPAAYAARLQAIHQRMGTLVRETGMKAE
jgi:tripartite-type tricarboxylate transporter receptor subunit TctC